MPFLTQAALDELISSRAELQRQVRIINDAFITGRIIHAPNASTERDAHAPRRTRAGNAGIAAPSPAPDVPTDPAAALLPDDVQRAIVAFAHSDPQQVRRNTDFAWAQMRAGKDAESIIGMLADGEEL